FSVCCTAGEQAENPEKESDLGKTWRLPLVLNAGDGLFSLSRTSILAAAPLDPAACSLALSMLDSACRTMSEVLTRSPAVPTSVPAGPSSACFAGLAMSLALVAAEITNSEVCEALSKVGEAFDAASSPKLAEGQTK